MSKRYNTASYIEAAKKVHDNRYTYPRTVYKNSREKIIVTCPIHGDFEIRASEHLLGKGCPQCGMARRGSARRSNTEEFIAKAKNVHGHDTYDYSRVEYKNSRTKVIIGCKKHGWFEQTPETHLGGGGCPKCANERMHTPMTTEEWVAKAKKAHPNDNYDYSLVVYRGPFEKVRIICPIHGEFTQVAAYHLSGNGCRQCGYEKVRSSLRDSEEDFVQKAGIIHDHKYTYDHVVYVNNHTPVDVTCPKHGDFKVLPYNHLYAKSGCPKCACSLSHWEMEMYEFIKTLCPDAVNRERSLLNGKEIDIYIPSLALGVECDGVMWHDERHKAKNYHIDKTLACKERGIRLIHVFEDEWNLKKEIVKDRIKSILGIYGKRIYARQCEIGLVDAKAANDFLNMNHLQGAIPSKFCYGLYYAEELVLVATFGKARKCLRSDAKDGNTYELLRLCSKKGVNVIGGASRLLKHFVADVKPTRLISYCDLRWSNGDVYRALGFHLDHMSQPSYFYVIDNIRHNRLGFTKDKLVREGYDKAKTEHEIMKERGIFRIYDCGCLVYYMDF